MKPLQAMACSKIFSGDLPEVSTYIIQNLRNDFNTLYSCALVNRFWCRLAIPLLWEDPFSIKYRENSTCLLLDTYFLFLNDNDKSKIKDVEFDSNLNLRKPLFNYPSFIKTLSLSRIQLHVASYITSSSSSTNSFQQPSNKRSYFPLTLKSQKESNKEFELIRTNETNETMKVICVILFKLFIKNNASLNNFYIVSSFYFLNQLFYDIYGMILNNPKFISEVEIFYFVCYFWPLQITSPNFKPLQPFFLSSLPSLFTSIKHIDIFINSEFVSNFANNIIQSQSQLSSIKIEFSMLFKVPLLNSLKYSSKTLTSIHFYQCYFSDNMRFDALSYLTQLESLQIKNCIGLESNVIQPLLNITTPLKIKTLVLVQFEIEEIISIDSLQLLIQKIGFYVENLVLSIYDNELRRKVFDVIIDFCEKIKFLHLNYIDFTNIPQLSKMIFNFNNYLKYLTLEIKSYDSNHFNHFYYNVSLNNNEKDLKISSMILKELSKSIPLSLYYLDLNLVINPDDLQILFENCNQVELKRLLIRNGSIYLDSALSVIREFVKGKNLEFLAYSIDSEKDFCHKVLEKLVKETQSFVKMKNHDDLVIRVSDIDGNLVIS